MSVYKQGDRKYDDGKDEGKKKKNPLDEMGAAAEKGLNEMAKNFSNFFGGKEKKWEKKGGGHTLGTAADDEQARQARLAALERQQSSGSSSARAPVPAHRPQSAAAAAAMAAAEARMQGGNARARVPAASQASSGTTPRGGGSTAFPGEGRSLAPPPAYDEEVALLGEMGFGAEAARSALRTSGGDVERAIEQLSLSGGSNGAAAAPTSPSSSSSSSQQPQQQLPAGPSPAALAAAADATSADIVRLGDNLSALPAGGACLQLIRKLVGNVRDSPNEPKFRKVRLSNPKIGAALGGRPDAFALLCACGFTLDGSGEYAEMGDAAALDASALEWACASLDSAVAQAAAGGPPVPIGPSDVKVLVAPEGGAMRQPEVGEDFFALTPAEAKAIMDANAARRAKEDRFMTREAREAERAKQRRVYRKGMVRVRFPDGVVLQATFSSAAPVSAVLAWVAESLSVPAAFELAMAGAGPLSDLTATLEQAELCPASLLNFRVHAQEQMQPPYLRHELMQRLQVLEDEVIPVGSGGDAWAPQTMGAEGDGRPLARQRSSEERKQPAWFRPPQ